MGTGIVLAGPITTITNSGTIETAVLTSTSSAPIPAGSTWGNTVEYNGSGAQTVVAGTYTTLEINNSGGTVSLGGSVTTTAFSMVAGTFDPTASYSLTATTPTLTAGTLRVGATTWAGNYSFTPTPPAGFTIEYYNNSPTINGAITYQNLQFSGTGTAGASAALTIREILRTQVAVR